MVTSESFLVRGILMKPDQVKAVAVAMSSTPMWSVLIAVYTQLSPSPLRWRSCSAIHLLTPPLAMSLARPRECVTLCAIVFTPSMCGECTGDLAKEVRDVSTQNKEHILLYSATYSTFSGSVDALCPLNEPSYQRQVLDEGNYCTSQVGSFSLKQWPMSFNLSPCIGGPLCHLTL